MTTTPAAYTEPCTITRAEFKRILSVGKRVTLHAVQALQGTRGRHASTRVVHEVKQLEIVFKLDDDVETLSHLGLHKGDVYRREAIDVVSVEGLGGTCRYTITSNRRIEPMTPYTCPDCDDTVKTHTSPCRCEFTDDGPTNDRAPNFDTYSVGGFVRNGRNVGKAGFTSYPNAIAYAKELSASLNGCTIGVYGWDANDEYEHLHDVKGA